MKKIGNYFITIVSIILALGLLFFIPTLLGGPVFSFGTINHYAQNRVFLVHPFYITDSITTDFFRFNSVFDEPGALGTLCVFVLFILRFNFKDWRTWVSILSGVFSFSFFFYGMVAIYWFLLALFAGSKNMISFLFAVVLFSGFYFTTRDNPIMSTMIWERFEWDTEKGSFKGDDRINVSGIIAYESLKGTSDYWLGLKAQDVEKFMEQVGNASSYKIVVATHGMVFFVLYTLFFLVLGWRYRCIRVNYWLYVVLVLFCFYQRTNVFSILYMFLYAYIARLDELEATFC